MRIILQSGNVIEKHWTPGNLTGYRAASILIGADDIHAMIAYLDREKSESFRAYLIQWMGRFPEARVAPSRPAKSDSEGSKAASQPLGSKAEDDVCPSCHGTGQPGGVKGGPELGHCGTCGGSGRMRRHHFDFDVPKALLDQVADRRDAARYRWLRDGNAYAPEENYVTGGEELDKLCDSQTR